MKPIQIPYVTIKRREYHQVGTLTLECTRWNQTTEKLIKPRFEIIDLVIKNCWKLQLSCVLGLSMNWAVSFDFWCEYI